MLQVWCLFTLEYFCVHFPKPEVLYIQYQGQEVNTDTALGTVSKCCQLPRFCLRAFSCSRIQSLSIQCSCSSVSSGALGWAILQPLSFMTQHFWSMQTSSLFCRLPLNWSSRDVPSRLQVMHFLAGTPQKPRLSGFSTPLSNHWHCPLLVVSSCSLLLCN